MHASEFTVATEEHAVSFRIMKYRNISAFFSPVYLSVPRCRLSVRTLHAISRPIN